MGQGKILHNMRFFAFRRLMKNSHTMYEVRLLMPIMISLMIGVTFN
jgi:hypothetical protein